MVKAHKLHKVAGLSAGLILFVLGFSGFLLDHDKWSFLYTNTFTHLPQSTYDAELKLYEAYWIDPSNSAHRIVGGKRGIFESFDDAQHFFKMLALQCLAIKSDENTLYAATSNGVYLLQGSTWMPYSLMGEYITSLSVSEKHIVAVIDKHELITIEKLSRFILNKSVITIDASKLQDSITLSRFVRDLHYGRGLFDGDISLLINDFSALFIVFLTLSAFFIWWFIRTKKSPKSTRKLIRYHASSLAFIALIPLLILSITGIFLDHSKSLAKFMNSITIDNSYLPPVYTKLSHDIWSVDFDGETYRIGNRYGVYKSPDLQEWHQETKGLSYKMIRHGNKLYVSGMGAPNRLYEHSWHILKNTPHMFKDVVMHENELTYFSSHIQSLNLPKLQGATLYSLLLTLHDGTFFSSWWVWVNDYASLALMLLLVTGILRWFKKNSSSLHNTSLTQFKIN